MDGNLFLGIRLLRKLMKCNRSHGTVLILWKWPQLGLVQDLNPVKVKNESEGLARANMGYACQRTMVVYNRTYDIISHAFVVPSLLTLMLESWKGVHNVLKKLNSFSGGIQALLQRLDIAGYCVAMNNTAVIVTHHSRHCMQPSVEIPGAKWKMLLVEYCA